MPNVAVGTLVARSRDTETAYARVRPQPANLLLQEHEEIVAAVVSLDVDAAALQTVGKGAMSVVELEDRLVVPYGQVREPNRPSLGVAPEVVVVDCLSTILRQRPRRARQDGDCDECGDGQHPPDADPGAGASV